MKSILAVLLAGSLLVAACATATPADEPISSLEEPVVTVYQSPA